jgi:hypothetical protein
MERWEYHCEFRRADVKNAGFEEMRKERWPEWKPAAYSPQSLMPALNDAGAKGWELVSMQPVYVDGNDSVQIPTTSTILRTNTYFCVYRRRLQEEAVDAEAEDR